MAPFLSWAPIVTPSLRPWQGKKREEGLYSLSYCKVSDLLLTTFRFVLFCSFCLFSVGGGRVLLGTEKKKEIYMLYINIYVKCIVLLYRLWLTVFSSLPPPCSSWGTQITVHLSRYWVSFPSPPSPIGLCAERWMFSPRRIQSMIPSAFVTALMIPRWS